MNDKETLEEAAEKFRSNNPGTMQGGNNTKILNAFKNGAKWQAERMYSEEEVKDMLQKRLQSVGIFSSKEATEVWFKQYKKQ